MTVNYGDEIVKKLFGVSREDYPKIFTDSKIIGKLKSSNRFQLSFVSESKGFSLDFYYLENPQNNKFSTHAYISKNRGHTGVTSLTEEYLSLDKFINSLTKRLPSALFEYVRLELKLEQQKKAEKAAKKKKKEESPQEEVSEEGGE